MKRIGVVGIPGGWSSERLADAVAAATGFRLLIDMAEVCLALDTGRVLFRGLDLSSLDAVIVKKIAPAYSPDSLDRLEILRFLKGRGVPVFSDPDSMLRLIDRLSGTCALRQAGIPMPDTVVTEDLSQAAAAVERFGRAVLKPLYGSKARGMATIEAGPGAAEALARFQAAGNPVLYVQRLVEHAGDRLDLGVSFLGDAYLATYARLGNGGSWNTTIRAGGRYAAWEPSPAVLDLARRAKAAFPGMAFTCVDVVESKHGPLVYEVSAFGGFRGLAEACGLDAADLYARYVLKEIG